jgi:hypothetical protein
LRTFVQKVDAWTFRAAVILNRWTRDFTRGAEGKKHTQSVGSLWRVCSDAAWDCLQACKQTASLS